MRRLGIVLLLVGLAGFLVASSRRGGYQSFEGSVRATFSRAEAGKKEFWENARWVSVGMAVIGVVLVVLPGKKGG
jgi:hypothetical protein